MSTPGTRKLNFEQIAKELNECAWLLTVNKRLTHHLEAQYNQWQIGQGRLSWPTPKILPFHSWLAKIWQAQNASSAHQPAQLIHPWAAHQLWVRIIKQSQHQLPLIHLAGLAKQSYEAWQLCQRWLVPHEDLKNHGVDERWHSWSQLYEKHLSDYNLIDNAQIARKIANTYAQFIDPKNRHFLIGFDELTPDISNLIENCPKGALEMVGLENPPSKATRVRFDHAEQELNQVALWASQTIEQKPDAKVAILVPQLAECHHQVQSEFAQIFRPSALPQYAALESFPFNISQGTPLIDEPLVAAAFAIFDLIESPLSTLSLSAVLGSPYLADQNEEASARSLLDKKLRRLNQRRLPHELVLRLSRDTQSSLTGLTSWTERWQQFCRLSFTTPTTADCHQQAQTLWHLLQSLGWSEGKTLSSREYQAKQQLLTLLEEYGRLNIDPEPHQLQQAISRLRREASNRIFQAETSDKPIQIMGLLEASELNFDYVWVMQMDDQHWPPAPTPNAFIPLSLQKKRRMPRTDYARELSYAQQITQRVQQMAPQVCFSYSGEGSEIATRPSPLIESLAERQWQMLEQQTEAQQYTLEQFKDDSGRPLPHSPDAVPGGAQLLNYQAECAFKAYAAHRLQAEPLQEPQPGRAAWERGQLVHYALETIWAELLDSNKLCALEEDALNRLVHQAIHKAQARLVAQRPGELTPCINEIEQQQVKQMLLSWLELEKAREPFKVVALESATEVALDNIKLSLRVDRIDETDKGRRYIIDYKTSQNNNLTTAWTSLPIREVQLPLYALSHPEQLAALLIGKLTSTEQKFVGLSAVPTPVPGVKQYQGKNHQPADWQELLHYWQQSIHELAQQAAAGFARVAPLSDQSCRHCAYPGFCRVAVLEFTDEEQDVC